MKKIFLQQLSATKGLFMALIGIALFIFLMPGIGFAQGAAAQDLLSVIFPNEQDGWVCGRWGTILHTNDGGATWTRQDSGTDYTLTSISFVDTKNGWAAGDGGTIIHTKDGGLSWIKQKSPVEYFLMGVHFANDQEGWIVTERTTILHTENGGKLWETQFSDEDFILKSVSFCDNRNGWAAGEFGYIYHTQDGGRNWQHQAGFYDISEETGLIIGENFLFDIVAIDPQTAWAVGIDGHIVATTNGGITWQKISSEVPKTHLFGIAADGNGRIIIGGSTVLLSSTDWGKTFTTPQLEPPITYEWLYKVRSRGKAGFVAVGRRELIYLIADGNVIGVWPPRVK